LKNFNCSTVEYLFAQNAELDINNNIVPKTGFSFLQFNTKEKNLFSENAKKTDGNIIYEQELSILFKYTDVTLLEMLNNAHLIIRLKNISSDIFMWGSIEPYNPVLLRIDTENKYVVLKFSRLNHTPELP